MENKSCHDSNNSDFQKKTIKIKPKIKVPDKSDMLTALGGEKSCSCSGREKYSTAPITQYDKKDHWITGEIQTNAGIVPQISTKLLFADVLGAWKVRWGINRMNYKINPGIYAVGTPHKDSTVLVTANYKLTFDALRKELQGLNAWILVLDTKGINVWCAAGKGTFGTQELVNRITKTRLNEIVAHRTLILPQLGAPGVSAHEVTRYTGFKVIYGTVRAKDLREFLDSGMKATDEMKTVKFNTYDRLVLTPIELISTFKVSMLIFGILFIINLIAANPFGFTDFYGYVGALLVGCVLTPILLPWIPGRAFAWKGWILGLLWAFAVIFLNTWLSAPSISLIRGIGYLLVLPSVSAFYAMNFTGSSTYTSFSGVLKEMRTAIPIIAISISAGIVLILLNTFFKL